LPVGDQKLHWSYSIWPKENKTEKPSFANIVDRDQIYNSVVNNLRKQTVLANEFGLELSKEMLQGELDRMARDTRDPKRLKELFASLSNNPMSITECVARPNLVNRLLQDQFSNSQSIHGELRRQAELELQRYLQTNSLGGSTVEIFTTDFTVNDNTNGESEKSGGPDLTTVEIGKQSFDDKRTKLAHLESNPARLQELASAFIYEEIVDESESSIKIKTMVWQKSGLNSWLTSQSQDVQINPVSKLESNFSLTEISSTQAASEAGPPDTWKDFTDIPRRRSAHTAIWTGTEMIVWGGIGSVTAATLNSGARYNPATNVWVSVSVVNAPSGRLSHTAIWSGTEMII